MSGIPGQLDIPNAEFGGTALMKFVRGKHLEIVFDWFGTREHFILFIVETGAGFFECQGGIFSVGAAIHSVGRALRDLIVRLGSATGDDQFGSDVGNVPARSSRGQR